MGSKTNLSFLTAMFLGVIVLAHSLPVDPVPEEVKVPSGEAPVNGSNEKIWPLFPFPASVTAMFATQPAPAPPPPPPPPIIFINPPPPATTAAPTTTSTGAPPNGTRNAAETQSEESAEEAIVSPAVATSDHKPVQEENKEVEAVPEIVQPNSETEVKPEGAEDEKFIIPLTSFSLFLPPLPAPPTPPPPPPAPLIIVPPNSSGSDVAIITPVAVGAAGTTTIVNPSFPGAPAVVSING